MSGQTRVDRIVLSDVIGRLPPGRARKKYEDLLAQFHDGESQGGVLCKGVSTPNQGNVSGKSQTACFALIAKTSRRVSPPVSLATGITVLDPYRFIDSTLEYLAAYVVAKNHGLHHYWVEDLLHEKLEQLELCGVTAEIVKVQ